MAKRKRNKGTLVDVLWLGDELLEQITGAEDDALYEACQVILTSAQGRAPVRKGRLVHSGYVASATRSSYQRTSKTARKQLPVGPGVAVVAFAEFYAHFMEGGTHGHEVKAKRARALQLGADGPWYRRAKVRGVQGRRFVHGAAESEANRATERFAAVIKRAIGG